MAAKGIGARVKRKEDFRLLRGRGRYVGDISMPGLREVAFVRSPLAHARIRAGLARVDGEMAARVTSTFRMFTPGSSEERRRRVRPRSPAATNSTTARAISELTKP